MSPPALHAASAPVLFGKLPARADFVRRGPESAALDAFDTLVQRARRPTGETPAGPLYRVVFAPPRGPDLLVGAVQSSQDRVGRAYPLFVGRPVARERLAPEDAPAWPLRWEALLDEAALVVGGAARRGATMEQVDGRVAGLPPAAGPRPDREAGHRAVLDRLAGSTLWWQTWGSTTPDRAALVLTRLAAAFGRPSVPSYGLQVSLPPQAPHFTHADAVAFWLSASARLTRRARAGWPTVLWHSEGLYESGALLLFPAGVTPRALHAALAGAPAPDLITVLDAGTEEAARRAATGLSAPFARLLADRSTSLAALLARLHTLP